MHNHESGIKHKMFFTRMLPCIRYCNGLSRMIMKAKSKCKFFSVIHAIASFLNIVKRKKQNGYNCAQGNPTYEENGVEITEAIRLIDS
ncbi:hypothetical protein [Bacillus sp. 123MFChir2]|uniref:hypothetical protein n=1 Tax=Bacillus sp. 123MFChir2 TaxID=1169144 RepID=UPI0003748796|nr:hypothetical protein [Bacillus sp. 123MFChir2]